MNLGLDGRGAAVAAGTRGLGLATAKALAAEGVRVAVCGRDPERLQSALAEISSCGPRAVGIDVDLATDAGPAQFMEFATSALSGVDILVCNCGGPPPGRPSESSVRDYELALRQNLLSAISMCSAVVPEMEARGWGRIVAISSHAVREPSVKIAASSTARAALTAFLKVLGNELAAKGITVNSVQPGAHDTDRLAQLGVNVGEMISKIPVGALGNPDDFGRIVAFLCSRSAGFVTGTSLLVDGGAYKGLI